MKQLAINLDNGITIEVVEVNGGWTTCRDIEDGFEFKLRNSKIGEYVAAVAEEPKAEEPKAAPAKPEYLHPAEVCPVCGVCHASAVPRGGIGCFVRACNAPLSVIA